MEPWTTTPSRRPWNACARATSTPSPRSCAPASGRCARGSRRAAPPPEVDSDEVAHLAFIHAYSHLAEYQPGTRFRAWLWTIARHQLMSEVTRARRREGNDGQYLPEAMRQALERGLVDGRGERGDEEYLEALRQCVDGLAPQARTLVDRLTATASRSPRSRRRSRARWPRSRRRCSSPAARSRIACAARCAGASRERARPRERARRLDAAARAELERRLRDEPGLLAEAMAAHRLHQLLPLALRGPGGDRFAEALCRRLRPPSGRFAKRVEKSVRRRAIGRRRRLHWRFAPLAVAALVALLIAVGRPPSPVSMLAQPPARRVAAADPPIVSSAVGIALSPGQVIAIGRELALPPSATLGLRWADGTTMTLDGEARARVGAALGKRLELDRGHLACSAAHQPEGRPLTIATPRGDAVVVGTRFELEVGSSTLLRVAEGAVRLRGADGAESLVHAGEEGRLDGAATLYALDFLSGLPAGWQQGALVDASFDGWARFAQTTEQGHRRHRSWGLTSEPRGHLAPFFPVHRGMSVELTLAQERPGQALLLMVLCRADTGGYVTNLMWQVDAEDRLGWQTMRFPLAQTYQGLDQLGDQPAVCTAWVLQGFVEDQRLRLAKIVVTE